MELRINGQSHPLAATRAEASLLEVLREDLDLTGTKNGCDIGVCGSCTVLVDGKPVKACMKKAGEMIGREILTIEGLTPRGAPLHPLQQAFIDHGAVQCGFCTPAMVLTGHALLLKDTRPSRETIRRAIHPVLCRCTGYQQIIDAIEDASSAYRPGGDVA